MNQPLTGAGDGAGSTRSQVQCDANHLPNLNVQRPAECWTHLRVSLFEEPAQWVLSSRGFYPYRPNPEAQYPTKDRVDSGGPLPKFLNRLPGASSPNQILRLRREGIVGGEQSPALVPRLSKTYVVDHLWPGLRVARPWRRLTSNIRDDEQAARLGPRLLGMTIATDTTDGWSVPCIPLSFPLNRGGLRGLQSSALSSPYRWSSLATA